MGIHPNTFHLKEITTFRIYIYHLLEPSLLEQVSISRAHELCRYDWMRDVLDAFHARLEMSKSTVALPTISEPLLPSIALC